MTDLLTPARAIAAVKFKWQKEGDAKVYDYFIPEGMDLKPGDKAIVATKRGETTVEIVAIKAESEMAEKEILRIAEEQPKAEEPKNEGWDF
jgi:hypothetical protein